MDTDTILAHMMHRRIAGSNMIGAFHPDALVEVGDLESIEEEVAAVGDFDAAAVHTWPPYNHAFAIISLDRRGLHSRTARTGYVERFIVCPGPDVKGTACLKSRYSASYSSQWRIQGSRIAVVAGGRYVKLGSRGCCEK